MTRATLLLAATLASTLCSPAGAVELMLWERLPLAVPLVVGHERVLFLDEDVRVGVPDTLSGKLRVQSVGGTVYLRASESISPSRLQLQSVPSGNMVLVDIETQTGDTALEPVKIITTRSGESTEQLTPVQPATSSTPIPVALTRYAAQNLYAPLRTVETLPGVRRVPVKVARNLSTLLPTERVTVNPLAAWCLADYWVTAVKIINRSNVEIMLDPRHLQATVFAASFQHHSLGQRGTPEDTTVVYLITRGGGLEQALRLPPPQHEGDDHEG